MISAGAQLQQLLPGILARRPRLPQGPVRFGRVLPLPRPGDLLRRVQRMHSHPCTVTLALPGWNSLDVCMYLFIAIALIGGYNAPMGGAVGWLLNGVYVSLRMERRAELPEQGRVGEALLHSY